jgi:glycine cleavage system transcriptional repressor
MAKAVISGIGPDQPGIVAALSSVLLKHGCNIEDSTMTRLAREFAVILIVQMPENTPIENLRDDFEALSGSHQLTTIIKPLPPSIHPESHVPHNPYMISVAGHDRTGITQAVSHKLAELSINITDLNAQVIPGDDGPVYIMMVEVDVPDQLPLSRIEQELKTLADQIGVEIQLRSLESVAL